MLTPCLQWAYVLNVRRKFHKAPAKCTDRTLLCARCQGSTQITSVDKNGRNYVATVNKGDLWYFPPGTPHSLQATNDNPDGTEFLLVRSRPNVTFVAALG